MTDAPGDRGSLTRDGTWLEPQRDWLPIARAIFRFAIAHTSGQRRAEIYQDDPNPFSIEAFEKFKSREERADADIVGDETDPLSLRNLTTTLRDIACARQAEIDLDTGHFKFAFDLPAGGAAAMGFAPWHLALLRDPEIVRRLELEALCNKGSGLVLITDEEAKQNAQRYEAARAAASLVWNRSMLPAFDRSVSDGRVKIYARVQSRVAQFQQLPADLWSRLKVEDWQSGTACDPEGDRYYSIHAAESVPQVSPPQAEVSSEPATDTVSNKMPSSKRRTNNARGRPPEYNWDEIKTFALDLVKKFGVPGEGNKKLPRQEDLVLVVQDEMANKHLHPGVSTVRHRVSGWLKELRS
jgi:hypothetical protein